MRSFSAWPVSAGVVLSRRTTTWRTGKTFTFAVYSTSRRFPSATHQLQRAVLLALF